MISHNQTSPRRRGHSMVEMVVVMSVLAGMAALSWPMIKSPMNKLRLQSAAQEVSAALSKARLKAMQSGEAQVFRVQLHTGKFQVSATSVVPGSQIEPGNDLESTPMLSQNGSEHSPMNDESDYLLEERELPEGICFEMAEDDDTTESIENRRPVTTVVDPDGEWTDFAIFYPNGGTTAGAVSLHGEPDFQVEVKLNGMTGIARIGETRRQELR